MSGIYYLYTDSEQHIILGLTEISQIETPLEFEISSEPGNSYINNKPLNTHVMTKNTLARLLGRVNVDVERFTAGANFRRFIYFNGIIFYRPFIQVLPQCDFNKKIGVYIAPLNVDITVDIIFSDPDQVSFLDKFKLVKVKDRNDLVTVPETLTLDASGKASFVINSAFPGICELRAKDDAYLCYYESASLRFKQ